MLIALTGKTESAKAYFINFSGLFWNAVSTGGKWEFLGKKWAEFWCFGAAGTSSPDCSLLSSTSALENAQNCSLTEEYLLLSLTTKNLLNAVQATARKKKGKVFSPLSNTRTYFL